MELRGIGCSGGAGRLVACISSISHVALPLYHLCFSMKNYLVYISSCSGLNAQTCQNGKLGRPASVSATCTGKSALVVSDDAELLLFFHLDPTLELDI